jgi:endonuclease YncB( thermonuclease family)
MPRRSPAAAPAPMDDSGSNILGSREVIGMRRTLLAGVLIVTGLGFAANALPGYSYPSVWCTVADVLDGDTIVVTIVGADTEGWIVGSTETVHYIGIDADEQMESFCGALATQVNYQMTFGRLVYLEFDASLREPDGTLLAYVYLDGGGYSMVNAALVALGIADPSPMEPNTRYDDVFSRLAALAGELHLGCVNEE